jgi:hypothetical protein
MRKLLLKSIREEMKRTFSLDLVALWESKVRSEKVIAVGICHGCSKD